MEEDLPYGMGAEDVERYCGQGYDYARMQVYSGCLRKGFPDDVINTICQKGLSGQQMRVSVEYYEKGIPLKTIQQMAAGEKTAAQMQKAYLNILGQLAEAQEAAEGEPEYVKKLMEEIKNAIDRIDYQEQRYDALNKKLAEVETGKREEKIKKQLEMESREKDNLLNKQQDELNQAKAAVARLRNEIESLKEEKKKVEKPKETVSAMGNSKEREAVAKQPETESKGQMLSIPEIGGSVALPEGFQGVITDQKGKVVAHIQKEKIQKEKRNLASILTKFAFRKKPRQDISHMVISGELDTSQLTQIRMVLVYKYGHEKLNNL